MRHEQSSELIIKNLRVYVLNQPGYFANLLTTISNFGVNIGDVKLLKRADQSNIREVEMHLAYPGQEEEVISGIKELEGIEFDSILDPVLEIHKGGKIEMCNRVSINTPGDIRRIYTPGVAEVCRLIQKNPEAAKKYTSIGNTVAIITNGTAILGLGDIGPVAGMPVMEGKAVLFKHLVGISGIPILIDEKDPQKIIDTILRIAPTFGAIKLEDFKAPECFEIEQALEEKLSMPVMHDDQHGTATVTLAALLSVAEYTQRNLHESVIGLIGLGAAGTGIAKLLLSFGAKSILGADIDEGAKRRIASMGAMPSDINEIMNSADIVIATTGVPGLIAPDMIRAGQVILALSNPNPEILPQQALAAGASFAADGRGVNNALAFPGLFRGALNAGATRFTDAMKIAAAQAIADKANREHKELVPALLNPEVHRAVTEAVERTALT